jgi:predicted phosphodiesterase
LNIQLLSDLHLETEDFEPAPAPQAELLVLAGDIDASWAGYQRFADWPVPVLVVAGNHEFDGRDVDEAGPALRAHVQGLGMTLLECESLVVTAGSGERVRFLGTARWCDFGVFGEAGRERAERAGGYFQRVMRAQRGGQPFDVAAVRAEADRCRRWLEIELARPARGQWQRTVVITHFAPSLRSADPRYGHQPGTASFCNADDDLIPRSDLWLHGHLHCRHDYRVPRPGAAPTRVACQARGLASRGEDVGFDPLRVLVLD